MKARLMLILMVASVVLLIMHSSASTVILSTCQASIEPMWPIYPGKRINFKIYVTLTPGGSDTVFIYRVFVIFPWDSEQYTAFNATSYGFTTSVYDVKQQQTVLYYLNDVSIPSYIDGGKSYNVSIKVVWGFSQDLYHMYNSTVNDTVYVQSIASNDSTQNQYGSTPLWGDSAILVGIVAFVAVVVLIFAVALRERKNRGVKKTETKETATQTENGVAKPPELNEEIIEKLKKLKELKDEGLLTEEEFESKRQELIKFL